MEDLDNESISSDDTSYSPNLTGVFHSGCSVSDGGSHALPTTKQKKTFAFATDVVKWVVWVTVLNLIILYFQTCVIQYTTVSGASMENTLHDHDVYW